MSAVPGRRLRDARARTKEATARALGYLRDHPGPRGERDYPGFGTARAAALRWCLLAEAVADAFDAADLRPSAGTAAGPPPLADKARFLWTKLTDRFPDDPYWEAVCRAGGVTPPEDAVRARLGAAAARFLALLDREAAGGFRSRVAHRACGELDAADWAELLVVHAADMERRLLRASLA